MQKEKGGSAACPLRTLLRHKGMKALEGGVEQVQRLERVFKHQESIVVLKGVLRSAKKKARHSILLLYLLYKQLGLMNLELSLNNQAIRYLLKAQHMLFCLVRSSPELEALQSLVENTHRSKSPCAL